MALVSRVFGFFSGAASGKSAGNVVDAVYERSRQNAWARRPYAILEPDLAAEADSQHLDENLRFRSLDGAGGVEQESAWTASVVDFADDAQRNGLGGARFRLLAQMQRAVPTLDQALQLWRRGFTDEATVEATMRRLGYVDGVRPALKRLRFIVPSVTDMVRFAVREVYNPAQRDALDLDAEFPQAFADDAERTGISGADAHRYWQAHWELPSYEQLSNMLFRGELTRDQFRNALKAADYAPTWRAKMEAIARAIPTMSDMIRFAVREVYNPAQRDALDLDAEYPAAFTAQAAKHGMVESDARDYWAAHWRLPSPEQGFRMFHRGEIDGARLNALLKALDYAPTWRTPLRNIAYIVPGRIDLRRMYAAGVIDRPRLKRGYLDLGYNPEDAETLTQFAVNLATGGGDDFVGKARTQLWTTTHRAFLAWDATDAVATEKLGIAGVPVSQIASVLAVWKAEREVIRARLTAAQIKKAWVNLVVNPATGVKWTREDALAELIQRGYSAADANTFLGE